MCNEKQRLRTLECAALQQISCNPEEHGSDSERLQSFATVLIRASDFNHVIFRMVKEPRPEADVEWNYREETKAIRDYLVGGILVSCLTSSLLAGPFAGSPVSHVTVLSSSGGRSGTLPFHLTGLSRGLESRRML